MTIVWTRFRTQRIVRTDRYRCRFIIRDRARRRIRATYRDRLAIRHTANQRHNNRLITFEQGVRRRIYRDQCARTTRWDRHRFGHYRWEVTAFCRLARHRIGDRRRVFTFARQAHRIGQHVQRRIFFRATVGDRNRRRQTRRRIVVRNRARRCRRTYRRSTRRAAQRRRKGFIAFVNRVRCRLNRKRLSRLTCRKRQRVIRRRKVANLSVISTANTRRKINCLRRFRISNARHRKGHYSAFRNTRVRYAKAWRNITVRDRARRRIRATYKTSR